MSLSALDTRHDSSCLRRQRATVHLSDSFACRPAISSFNAGIIGDFWQWAPQRNIIQNYFVIGKPNSILMVLGSCIFKKPLSSHALPKVEWNSLRIFVWPELPRTLFLQDVTSYMLLTVFCLPAGPALPHQITWTRMQNHIFVHTYWILWQLNQPNCILWSSPDLYLAGPPTFPSAACAAGLCFLQCNFSPLRPFFECRLTRLTKRLMI